MFAMQGGFQDLVASTRVRLARNVKGYAYQGLTAAQQQELADKIWDAISAAPAVAGELTRQTLAGGSQDAAQLVEKHLISPEFARRGGTLIASNDGGAAIMLGEEDHIRLQVIGAGFCPRECMEAARRLAALIEGREPMDYSPKLGYLTACPSNLGTGLRASVMLHLPLLTSTDRIEQLMGWAGQQGFTVRGAYGEGSQAVGGFYQLSNQVTLGLSEDAIIEKLTAAATEVMGREKRLREAVRSEHALSLSDRICRAVGALQTARMMDTNEATGCLSDVLIGLQMGYLTGITAGEAVNLLQSIRPSFLEGTPEARDVKRAEKLREAAKRIQIV